LTYLLLLPVNEYTMGTAHLKTCIRRINSSWKFYRNPAQYCAFQKIYIRICNLISLIWSNVCHLQNRGYLWSLETNDWSPYSSVYQPSFHGKVPKMIFVPREKNTYKNREIPGNALKLVHYGQLSEKKIPKTRDFPKGIFFFTGVSSTGAVVFAALYTNVNRRPGCRRKHWPRMSWWRGNYSW
jgi:hypothetical protein